MITRSGRLLIVSAALLAGVAGSSLSCLAQETAATTTAAAPAQPVSPEAKAVFEKARAAYKALKTYQDKTALKFEMKAKTPDGQDQNQDDSEEIKFVYAGAQKYAMTHKDFGLFADGATRVLQFKPTSEYMQRPIAEEFSEEEMIGPIGMFSAIHAPSAVLLNTKADAAFPLLVEATTVTPEERNGKAGKRVSGSGKLPGMPIDAPVPMTIWFDDSTSLIGELTFDLKPLYTKMVGDQMTVDKALATVGFGDVEVNADVSAAQYAFTPGAADKKVDQFGMGGENGPDPQLRLVGAPAPDLKGVDLDGKPLSLSDFKGKVVLMDFWATWCPPCVKGIPNIQELWSEYESKGVVVMGINQDDSGAKDKVVKFVADKKLTFRQFMDPEGAAGQAYLVTGIPCTVLIDAKGVIQKIHTGYSPSMKKELAADLDKLLKGESLVEPKKEEPKDGGEK